MKGVVANGLNKLGVKVALWDTIPEEMIRDSIDSLLEQLEKDSIEGGYDNSKFDEAYGMYRKFLSLGIEIEDTSIQELMGRSTDEFTENEYLQLLVKKENLSFMKEISDQLDAGFAEYDALKHTIGLADEIKQELARNYIARTKNLLAIKQALLDTGYDNETVNRTIDEMLREYQDSYLRAIKMTLSKVADKGIDKAMGKAGLLKLFPLHRRRKQPSSWNDKNSQPFEIGIRNRIVLPMRWLKSLTSMHRSSVPGSIRRQTLINVINILSLPGRPKFRNIRQSLTLQTSNSAVSVLLQRRKKADARQMIQEIEAEIQRLSALKDTADAAYQQLEGGMGGR